MMKTKQKTLRNKYFSKTLLVDSPYFQHCATPTTPQLHWLVHVLVKVSILKTLNFYWFFCNCLENEGKKIIKQTTINDHSEDTQWSSEDHKENDKKTEECCWHSIPSREFSCPWLGARKGKCSSIYAIYTSFFITLKNIKIMNIVNIYICFVAKPCVYYAVIS